METTKYSVNVGIWGTSVGGVETLTSNEALPEEAYPTQLSRTESSVIEVEFEKGETTTGSNSDGDKKKTLVVGTSADYPPFEYVDTAKSNEIIGFDIELIKIAAEKQAA